MSLFSIRKTQKRTDLFNKWADVFNEGKPESKKEYVEARLFDEALRHAAKFLKYKKRKLKLLKQQEEELML